MKTLRIRTMVLLMTVCAVLSGCTSDSSKVQVGPIAFTDANGNELAGTHSSMAVGTTTYVDVAITNDTSLLGVDWTVSCGSEQTNLPAGEVDTSCGTFTPVHTASAPVPSYAANGSGVVTLYTAPSAPPKGGVVTLHAAATADHSRVSSVTLIIVGDSISIAFAPAPVSSLTAGATTSLKAVVVNDYGAGGVKWAVTCSSANCGSFSDTETASGVATKYTAPPAAPTGGSVTITATSVADPTKWVSAGIAIE